MNYVAPTIARTWGLVPLKKLAACKSRLSPLLTADQRQSLQRAMLSDVLAALVSSRSIGGIAMITADSDAARMAAVFRAVLIEDADSGDLNTAIRQGTRDLTRLGAERILVVSADIPLLTPAGVDRLMHCADRNRGFAIVADRQRGSTNALVFPAHSPPSFAFGQGSFLCHRMQMPHGVDATEPFQSFALDIDTPADLSACARQLTQDGRSAGSTTAWLHETFAQLDRLCA